MRSLSAVPLSRVVRVVGEWGVKDPSGSGGLGPAFGLTHLCVGPEALFREAGSSDPGT